MAFDLASIRRRIETAGFRAGEMWIRASGVVVSTSDGRPGFRIRNWPDSFELRGTPVTESPDGAEPEVVTVRLDFVSAAYSR